jgi:excisionase family DNA binding protein
MEPVERNGAEAEPWIEKEEAAEYLNVSVRTLKRWVASGTVPHGRAGKQARFRRSELDAWMLSQGRTLAAVQDV